MTGTTKLSFSQTSQAIFKFSLKFQSPSDSLQVYDLNFLKLPKVSHKQRLLKEVCEKAAMDIVLAATNQEVDSIFDEVFEDILLVGSKRYSITPQPVPKSDQWFMQVLPNLDNERYIIF